VSYTEYRRRRRRKENLTKLDSKASSVSRNGSLQRQKLKSSDSLSKIRLVFEHIYQSISSELGVISCEKGGVNSGINDTNDSGRSLSPAGRRFISREGSVESSGHNSGIGLPFRSSSLRSLSRDRDRGGDKSTKRKSLLNTSYSSEEVLCTGSTGMFMPWESPLSLHDHYLCTILFFR
jgi:hypothetical protein